MLCPALLCQSWTNVPFVVSHSLSTYHTFLAPCVPYMSNNDTYNPKEVGAIVHGQMNIKAWIIIKCGKKERAFVCIIGTEIFMQVNTFFTSLVGKLASYAQVLVYTVREVSKPVEWRSQTYLWFGKPELLHVRSVHVYGVLCDGVIAGFMMCDF